MKVNELTDPLHCLAKPTDAVRVVIVGRGGETCEGTITKFTTGTNTPNEIQLTIAPTDASLTIERKKKGVT